MSKTSTVGQRVVGSVVGLLAGGMSLGALLAGLYGESWGEDWALGAFIFYGGLGFLIGGTLGAVLGSFVAHSQPEPRSSFARQGNETHCKKCGSELIGPGGPCRKCDDVETRPCLSCGRYVLLSDTACVYCGAEVK